MKDRGLSRVIQGWMILLQIGLLLVLPQGGVAADGGRTAADFLKVGFGARAAALGGAMVASTDGAEAAYWNPAGLGSMSSGGQVTFSHFSWYQDINVEHGAIGFRLNDDVALATSMMFLSYGQIDGYGIDGQPTNQLVSAYDWAGTVSASWQPTSSLAVGVGTRFINQKLDDISASAFAFDIGLQLKQDWGQMGIALTNLGDQMSFDNNPEPLPSQLSVGAALKPIGNNLTVALQLDRSRFGDLSFRNGIEVELEQKYFLRAGCRYMPDDQTRGLIQAPALGVGMKWGRSRVDYAFTATDRYSSESLHRITLSLEIGQ